MGHSNPIGHNFCGECGDRLTPNAAGAEKGTPVSSSGSVEAWSDPERASLEGELARLDEEAADLAISVAERQVELAEFERAYFTRLGALVLRLAQLEADFEEQHLQGHVDPRAEQRASQARARAEEAAGSVRKADSKPAPAPPSDELKDLFKKVARTVHPDLEDDPALRPTRTKQMAAANEAYERGDLDALNAVLDKATTGITSQPIGDIYELEIRVAARRRSVGNLAAELRRLDQSGLASMLRDWQRRGEDAFVEWADLLEVKCQALEDALEQHE